MMTVKQVAKKYNLSVSNAWRILKEIGADKEVKRGKKTFLFFDEARVDEELRKRGYTDLEANEMMKKVWGR